MAFRGKRYKSIKETINADKTYNISEAIDLLKKSKKLKFDETVDIAINLGVDPKHADQIVKGVIKLPHGSGKTVKIAVFAKDEKASEAKEAGADFIGSDDLALKLEKNQIQVDRVVATPDMMAVVGKLGKTLGPKGLMPNPKLGTVTKDIKKIAIVPDERFIKAANENLFDDYMIIENSASESRYIYEIEKYEEK